MYLYHGTYEDNFEIIESTGVIRCNSKVSQHTYLLNTLIQQDDVNFKREGCIYLSEDNSSTEAYDFAYTIDVDILDKNKLYVADNRTLDDILCSYYSKKPDAEIKRLIKQYKESFVSFKYFLKNKKEYSNKFFAEFYISKIYIFDY